MVLGLEKGKIQLDYCSIELVNQNTLIFAFTPGIEIGLDKILPLRKYAKAIYEKFGFLPHTITIIPQEVTITKEAREYGSTREANLFTNTTAVIVNSLPHKLIINFIIKVQKPVIPFKSFNNIEDAMAWIQQFDTSPATKPFFNELYEKEVGEKETTTV